MKTTAIDVLLYLPCLKEKFAVLIGTTNELQDLLINSAFKHYELYMRFLKDGNLTSEDSEQNHRHIQEKAYLELASLILNYNTILRVLKKSKLMEVDAKLLKDIFKEYRESRLAYKHQRTAYSDMKKTLTSLLIKSVV
jgi:hypothetical protein